MCSADDGDKGSTDMRWDHVKYLEKSRRKEAAIVERKESAGESVSSSDGSHDTYKTLEERDHITLMRRPLVRRQLRYLRGEVSQGGEEDEAGSEAPAARVLPALERIQGVESGVRVSLAPPVDEQALLWLEGRSANSSGRYLHPPLNQIAGLTPHFKKPFIWHGQWRGWIGLSRTRNEMICSCERHRIEILPLEMTACGC